MAERRSRGPGRPALPAEQRKALRVQFRVTEGEWAELVAAAEAAGLPLHEWVLATTLRAARRSARRGRR